MSKKAASETVQDPTETPPNSAAKAEQPSTDAATPIDPLLDIPTAQLPHNTGAAHATKEGVYQRLRTLVTDAGAEITLHGWQVRVRAADGSSVLIIPTESGELQVLAQRGEDNLVTPVKGPTTMSLNAFIESLRSTQRKQADEDRHQRTASPTPPKVATPPETKDETPPDPV